MIRACKDARARQPNLTVGTRVSAEKICRQVKRWQGSDHRQRWIRRHCCSSNRAGTRFTATPYARTRQCSGGSLPAAHKAGCRSQCGLSHNRPVRKSANFQRKTGHHQAVHARRENISDFLFNHLPRSRNHSPTLSVVSSRRSSFLDNRIAARASAKTPAPVPKQQSKMNKRSRDLAENKQLAPG